MTLVDVTRAGDLAIVTINNPPVNATSQGVRQGLADAVGAVAGAKAALLRCEGRTFVAGGDIAEFDGPALLPHLPDVVQMIEDSPVPFIALVHGTVLGGGFEIAMACAWRIAAPGTRFGLPEVNVGLIPGAGGSQRAPRLLPMRAAVDMACHGKLLGADALLEMGGIDRIASGDLIAAGTEFAANLPPRPEQVSARKADLLDAEAYKKAEAELTRRAKGAIAPLANLEALHWAALPFAEGQPRERARHLELRAGAQSRALRHAFFAERLVARPSAIKRVEPRPSQRIAIVGGGLMGAGIATACLGAGRDVVLIERDAGAAAAAQDRVAGLIDGAAARGKLSAEGAAAQLARLTTTDRYSDAADVDMAIEAVFEDLAVKRAVFAELAAALRPEAILATNTSYIDPRAIFDGVPGPERCVGLHFFSPAHVMKLLEIVKTPTTAADVLATGFALGRDLRKVAVLSGICDGFIGNRMLTAYRRAAEYLLADGAMPHEVDAAMRAMGMPMGPFELQDLTGLQIAWANRKRQAATRPASERYVTLSDQLCEMDRLGQRSGKGWYRYAEGSRTPERDPEVEALISAYRTAEGITPQSFDAAEIGLRLFSVLANEGARIIEEGIAETGAAVDMVKVHGYGFPRWRGGPMCWADETGWDKVAGALARQAETSPGAFILSRQVEAVR